MKKELFKLILLCYIFFNCCILQSQENVKVKQINNQEAEIILFNMGMRNLPALFYDYYYKYPESVKELYSFIENHYDYINEPSESWQIILLFLKQNEDYLNIITQRGLFIIFQDNNLSYNNNDICNTLALHSPETSYMNWKSEVNLYNSNNRNIKEIIGLEKADSIINIFHKLNRNIYSNETNNYFPEDNHFVKFDKYRRVLLEYDINNGLQTYCPEESLILSDYPFFEKLDSICNVFCRQQNINKIIFNTSVFKKK